MLGIGASRAIAQAKGFSYSYADGPRVMTEQEQIDILGEVEVDNVCAITKIKDKEGNIFPGYGSWPRDTEVHGHDKGNTKRNMAFIRSERNALDRMAPGTLPDVEIMDEAYSPVHNISEELAAGKKEFTEGVQADINEFWPPGETVVTDAIDMVWLKESLQEIRDTKPLVYNEICRWLKNELGGKRPESWGSAVAELSLARVQALCNMVAMAREL